MWQQIKTESNLDMRYNSLQWRYNGHDSVSNHHPHIVYLAIYLGADQRKYQSSASLTFVRGIHRWPVNSPHKWPVTRKMFPFDDVVMSWEEICLLFAVCHAFSVLFKFDCTHIIQRSLHSDATQTYMTKWIIWIHNYWSHYHNETRQQKRAHNFWQILFHTWWIKYFTNIALYSGGHLWD